MTAEEAAPHRDENAGPDPADVYEIHARNCDDEDFWGQVRRTVGGVAVAQDQIDLIVDQCRTLLSRGADDPFIDLCCGNGALTARVFGADARGVGVDSAPTLINIAQKHFGGDAVRYVVSDVVEWAETANLDFAPVSALLYGSVNFIPADRTPLMLSALRRRFPAIRRLVIGNVADREKMDDFFHEGAYRPGVEDDPASAIGYWWGAADFAAMAKSAGWNAEIHRMPTAFVASHYRYDAVLTPGAS